MIEDIREGHKANFRKGSKLQFYLICNAFTEEVLLWRPNLGRGFSKSICFPSPSLPLMWSFGENCITMLDLDTHVCTVFVVAAVIFFSNSTVDAQCNGTMLNVTATAVVGSLTSPNYPAPYEAYSDCSWRLASEAADASLIITIQAMELERCRYDQLTIYTVDPNNETIVNTSYELCSENRMLGEVLISQTGVFYFTFTSDFSVQYSGWKVIYYIVDTAYQQPCGSQLDASLTAQIIQSENAGGVYENDYLCEYTITTSVASAYIRIEFLFMDIESSDQCTKDKFTLYDGTVDNDVVVSTLCHRSEDAYSEKVDTSTSTGTVVFSTDSETQFYGYVFSYKAHVDAQGSAECSATGISLVINVGDSATIETPGYPNSYTNYMDCRWTVTGTEGYGIQVKFEDVFSIETNTYCGYDYLAIYDGATTSSNLLNKFCGTTTPTSTILTTSNVMLVVFSSDYSITRAGFRIKYDLYDASYPNCLALFTVYNVNETVRILESPNYPSRYDSNTDIYYLLRNQNSTFFNQIIVDFKRISIERATNCIYDRLIIYNGGCPSSGVAHTLCGYNEEVFELEMGADVLLHFHTDGSLNYVGFQLEYYLTSTLTTVLTTPTTATLGPPVQAVIALMDEVLTNYSAEVLPLRDLSQFVESKINFYLVGINDLDEVEQKLTTTGQFDVQWRDAFLSWIPSKKSDIVQMLMPQNDLWKPDIVMMNGFSTITEMGASFMYILLDYNGTCVWRPYQIMTSTCQVDMTYFPYDTQECKLKFGTWASSDRDVKTEIGADGLQIHENFQQNAEWTLLGTSTSNGTENGNGVVIFTLRLKRTPSFVLFYMTIPIILLAFLNVFTFALPLESGEKSGFSITLFLSFVVFLIITSQKMPANSDTISYFASYVLAMTFISGITLMISVIELRLLTFTTLRYGIRPGVQRFVQIVQIFHRVLLCQKKEDTNKVEQLVAMEELRMKLNRLYIPERHKPLDQTNEDDADLIVSTPPPVAVNDEDEVKSVQSDVSSIRSGPPCRPIQVNGHPSHSAVEKQSEKDVIKAHNNVDIDWLDVCHAFDFVLFWILLILILTLTIVYMLNMSG